ncbi:hypothetical protein U9M48_035810 [Paspalum notatum var. saurae]|uniref:Uncharacterized protein n=1 Tax=Paspalum notatum var. saurae TaxID=547442 RepID=A0AAQ3X8T0_PASNO
MDTVAATGAGASPFEPSQWGDFFSYLLLPCHTQRSEEWMRERVDQLKSQVHHMFDAGSAMSAADTLMLVDALERLGIDNLFQEEIDKALCRVHSGDLEFGSSEELHIVALRFRLLRQHGLFVSTDVFDKYIDGTGTLSIDLISDPRGLLSLYNAAHMAVPGEDVLDHVISFTRSHLMAIKGSLAFPLSDQITRALYIPLPRYMHHLETMHYITEYKKEELHNATVLELATVYYNITRSLYLKELRAFSLWWKRFYEDIKLTYARDRAVETYFWGFGIFQGVGNSRGRIMYSKTVALLTLMDDTYDVHATFEECEKLNEAIQIWDQSAASILPEYLREYYIKTLKCFNEFEDILESDEKFRFSYIQKAIMLFSTYYLEEAKWCNENYMPCFKDQVELSIKTAGEPVLALAALMAMDNDAMKDSLEWANGVPDMLNAKGRKNKNDMASSLECYMNEYGTTRDEATTILKAMVEHAWRRINQACMEIDRALLPAVKFAAVNQAKTSQILYCDGKDAFTFGGDLVGLVTSLFLKPVPPRLLPVRAPASAASPSPREPHAGGASASPRAPWDGGALPARAPAAWRRVRGGALARVRDGARSRQRRASRGEVVGFEVDERGRGSELGVAPTAGKRLRGDPARVHRMGLPAVRPPPPPLGPCRWLPHVFLVHPSEFRVQSFFTGGGCSHPSSAGASPVAVAAPPAETASSGESIGRRRRAHPHRHSDAAEQVRAVAGARRDVVAVGKGNKSKCRMRSEEWMRERVDQLKSQVHHMFDAGSAMSAADTLMLVDALERLGIDNLFQEEIDEALHRVHSGDLEFGSTEELHIVTLRFRLLRQHGLFVSTDVFDKYIDDSTGTLSTDLIADPRGLLSLDNAAHMAVPGEDVLDHVISFTRSHGYQRQPCISVVRSDLPCALHPSSPIHASP